MKVYILTKSSGESAFMKTFKFLGDLFNEIDTINKKYYDGNTYSIFGRSSDDEPYNIDSVVLVNRNNVERQIYDKFLIRCIDGNTGQIIDLDTE